MTSLTKSTNLAAERRDPPISAADLARAVGQKFLPTEQQAGVIEAPDGPLLVVAGAGAGKTETMAARVVWLVANGFARPEEVLGLTFTRKAARQLNQRIRDRLGALKNPEVLRALNDDGSLAERLDLIEPTVATYDSFAGTIVREFGLLAPVEPDARLITKGQLVALISSLVSGWGVPIDNRPSVSTVITDLADLDEQMNQHVVPIQDVREETEALLRLCEELPKGPRQSETPNQEMQKVMASQRQRLGYLDLIEELRCRMTAERLSTFGQQMAVAATVAQRFPQVGETLRRRYRIVMLDEYQDTSHSQRVVLSELFGKGVDESLTVTAVGDPMQAIYGWRGATASNLTEFVRDFPQADGSEAPRRELTTSWRNPSLVLDLANSVTDEIFGKRERTVSPLSSRQGAEPGHITLGFSESILDERARVADHLAERYQESREAGESFTGAVLVRKRRHIAPIADELRARGVPVEVVGIGELLSVPEVADVLCIARMLVHPEETSSALRILSGPLVGLGSRDIAALAARARALTTRMRSPHEGADEDEQMNLPTDDSDLHYPEDELLAELERVVTEKASPDEGLSASLTDALADVDDDRKVRYSPEGYERITRFGALLRQLRVRGLDRPVPDILSDIMQLTGLRTEVLARENPTRDGAIGTVHLDRLLEEAGAFADIPGASLSGFLHYCDLAAQHDQGLEPGDVTVRADRVQVLTVHKAKGLEWQHVAVLHATDKNYGADKASIWPKNAKLLPSDLRGDAGYDGGTPVLDTGAENRKELETAIKELSTEVRERENEENARLFYVAMTRAERSLIISASEKDPDNPVGERNLPHPHAFLADFAQKHPEYVGWWYKPGEEATDATDATDAVDVADTPDSHEPPPPCYPHVTCNQRLNDAAQVVREAMAGELPSMGSAELHSQWESDVTALIEEHERAQTPVIDVQLGRRLTVSDMVRLKDNPQWFARRLRRPVPFKPQSFAKRGTAFHSWLEDRFGKNALLDDTELPGMDDTPGEEDLADLKERFLASEWAERTPAYVEEPFELFLGNRVIRGRMDAIFPEPDGSWLIIDWKTGRPPKNEKDRHAAVIQLAAYAVAWEDIRRHAGEEHPRVRAAFHYVAAGYTAEPESLPTREELIRLLDD